MSGNFSANIQDLDHISSTTAIFLWLCGTKMQNSCTQWSGILSWQSSETLDSMVRCKDATICQTKVNVPKSNIAIIWTPIFEWYVVRCGSINIHQKYMQGLKEIGLCALSMLTIRGSMVNMMAWIEGGDLYDNFMNIRI